MGKVYDCDQWNYVAKGKSTLRNHQKLSIKGAIKERDLIAINVIVMNIPFVLDQVKCHRQPFWKGKS